MNSLFSLFFRLVYFLYAVTLFLSYLIIGIPIILFSFLLGPIRGGNLIYAFCRSWADVVMPLIGLIHKNIYEFPHDKSKSYVFVFNHNSFLDAAILMKTIRAQHIRILGRADLAAIPIFGWLYRQAVISVDRSSAKHRAQSLLELKAYLSKNISVVIAPEGTFNMTHQPLSPFFDGAFKIAIETQTPIKPIIFPDNLKRLHYKSFFSLQPGNTRAIFLEEVSVEGYSLAEVGKLKNKIFTLMEEKLIQYEACWIQSKQA